MWNVKVFPIIYFFNNFWILSKCAFFYFYSILFVSSVSCVDHTLNVRNIKEIQTRRQHGLLHLYIKIKNTAFLALWYHKVILLLWWYWKLSHHFHLIPLNCFCHRLLHICSQRNWYVPAGYKPAWRDKYDQEIKRVQIIYVCSDTFQTTL